MQLQSLTLDGFKSFADKTTIKFNDGITGIVGPNGSGKSNIIEAMRWVMGEQSAKNLRGDKMADVIFNGSTDRKPLNRALVSMTFDNSDHYLKSDFTTVTITRKLYRNGDSEYQINGNDVRLRDIVNLFVDTGIGRDSFSIINQGQIEAIFNGKPEDRRAVIEAVAGVSKYKANKKTAEKRLSDTNDNLNRVHDIVVELNGQMEPLAEQSALAKDYLEQKDQYELLDRTAIVRQVTDCQKQLTKVKEHQAKASQLVSDYEQQLNTATSKLADLKRSQAATSATKDQLAAQVLATTEKIAKLENARSVASVKEQQRTAELKTAKGQQQTLLKQRQATQQQLDTLAETLEQAQKEISDHQQELAEAKQLSGKELREKLARQLDSLRGQQVDLLQQQTSLHNQLVYLQRNHEQSANQSKQSQAQLQTATAEYSAAKETVNQLAKKGQGLAQKLTDLAQQLDQENVHQQKLASDYQKRQRQWYEALNDVNSAQSRLKSYRSMAADYTSYYQGVKNVLRDRDHFHGLFGPVNELISVPADYTKAFDTVLGGQLQQLVVNNQTTGRQIINYLVQNRAGRVTILPLDTLRQRPIPAVVKQLESMPGFVGSAPSLISYDRKFQVVVNHLLANTVLADNLAHATTIARAGHHQIRVVTLDGQLINASGSMTGGAQRHARTGLLAQQQMAANLGAEVKKQQQAATQIESDVARLEKAKNASQELVGKLREQHQQQSSQVEAARTSYRVAETRLKEQQRRLTALQYEANQAASDHDDYQQQVAQTKQSQQKVASQLAGVKGEIESVTKQEQDAESNADAAAEHLHQLEQWLAVHQERRDQTRRDLDSTKNELEKIKQHLAANADSQAALKKGEGLDDQTAAEKISQSQEELKAAKDQQASVNDRLAKLNDDRDAAETHVNRLQELRDAAKNEASDVAATQVKLEGQIDHGLNRLSDQYSMTLEEAAQHVSDLPDNQLQTKLRLLRRGIADLGDVNTGAIDEYQRIKDRYDFLEKQQNDLVSAREQLQKTMNEMDGQVKERFKTTFDAVNKAFAKTFEEIFEGGRAKLKLTDPHDLLTTGVDIMAQPPGKKTTQMSLLSGGEKALTAITLLFAIIRVRPVPFAILDEPEAALDDLNVQRFANYLGRFGKSGPQFIVITHRKGTMENADVLYGVTMQDSGVSRMVSVNVVDALAADSAEK